MTIEHLLVTCPVFQPARYSIISHLNKDNLALNEYNILNDKFNHNLLFKFLKDVDFFKKC